MCRRAKLSNGLEKLSGEDWAAGDGFLADSGAGLRVAGVSAKNIRHENKARPCQSKIDIFEMTRLRGESLHIFSWKNPPARVTCKANEPKNPLDAAIHDF
jgi:hypothetical protein